MTGVYFNVKCYIGALHCGHNGHKGRKTKKLQMISFTVFHNCILHFHKITIVSDFPVPYTDGISGYHRFSV